MKKTDIRLTPIISEAELLWQLIQKEGLTIEQAAEKTGVGVKQAYNLIQFWLKAPQEVKELVDNGEISMTSAISLMRGKKNLRARTPYGTPKSSFGSNINQSFYEKVRTEYIKEVKYFIAALKKKKQQEQEENKKTEQEFNSKLYKAIKDKFDEVVLGPRDKSADLIIRSGNREFAIEIKSRRK